jgi:hypothetical protein
VGYNIRIQWANANQLNDSIRLYSHKDKGKLTMYLVIINTPVGIAAFPFDETQFTFFKMFYRNGASPLEAAFLASEF